ncbi:HDOD domain-containing protein [Candidatus Uabimicrobium amorphum]|uniref:Phosphohydrolase n=1 Tax=Uabimicrobium amorphum TaxID=2596890 RepID=A0A5S9IPC4_UABAM|nr:HDOD domain-containing protein [Candidatus Uabimicrobium amorphum]BBM85001.1 phosphohydrolase [Candidatus Uabimicrobium amorphum]
MQTQELNLVSQFEDFTNEQDFKIPTIPQNTLKLLDLLNSPNSSTEEIEQVVSLDPAIAGEILKVSNSALYGSRIEVTSIKLAITRLGRRKLRTILFAISIKISFIKDQAYRKQLTRIWEKSLFCAFVCSTLAKKSKKDEEEYFLVGLMHNIGQLVIVSALQNFCEKIQSDFCIEEDLLEMLFAAHEHKLGKRLLNIWKIPEKTINVIMSQNEDSEETYILKIALSLYEEDEEATVEYLNVLNFEDVDYWLQIAAKTKQEVSSIF